MKRLCSLVTVILVLSGVAQCQNSAKELSASLSTVGPYFDQEPPGDSPELFAPGLISRDGYFEHSAAVYSPDMTEVYWSALDRSDRYYKMYSLKQVDGKWTAPDVVPFLEENRSEKGPVFSPDGNSLYFDLNCDIWVVRRTGEGWSEPEKVPGINDASACESVCGLTRDGSIFFTRYKNEPGSEEVYVSRRSGEGFAAPQKIERDFRAGFMRLGGVYVAPDESYMIMELQIDPATGGIFASYKTNDGGWSDVIRLPVGWARFPYVTPDGKYLIFMRREGIYWVNAGIIEDTKSENLK